ncbi:HAMP domain-containing sensor histidine kinase [Amycolatopsis ultiminotia]|uniref:histidine kinase n=1 Tax=Amycolatopsis ultiminotia TaxID=543629 RepID=A0ABP6WF85_9PSEU
MRKRIILLTVLAGVLAISLFGLPLAIGVARYYLDDERAELERLADSAALSVSAQVIRHDLPDRLPAAEANTSLALYNPAGSLLTGSGPARLEAAGAAIRANEVIADDTGTDLVATVPITDAGAVVGMVRAATPHSEVDRRTALTWLGMGGLAVVALAATWLVAHRLSVRLAAPLEELSTSAARLGEGDFTVRTRRSRIPEIDRAGIALDTTAGRIGEVLARERAFSADASHQLRTPLAGLQLQLEVALESPDTALRPAVTAALETTYRLDRTIRDLLALARDAHPGTELVEVKTVLAEIRQDWHGLLAAQGRVLLLPDPLDVAETRVSALATRQAMTVLLDNASRHGRGTVTVTVRDMGDTAAFDVTDEGPGLASDADPFRRRSDSAAGHGIGLALARSLAEAEGGRLRLGRSVPPTFTLLLPIRQDDARGVQDDDRHGRAAVDEDR